MPTSKNFNRYRGEDLERLAKVDILTVDCKKVRKKLRKTIEFAVATERPERAEWCEILLKKFSQPKVLE